MIRNRLFIYSILSGLLLFGAAVGGFYVVKAYVLQQIGPATQNQYLYIKPGSAVSQVATEAMNAGLVKAKWHLSVGARMLGVERQLRAGEYEVRPGSTVEDLLYQLKAGETYLRRLVIPEGYSVLELETLLNESFGLDTADLSLPAEGSILPETYFYNRGENANIVVARMQIAMDEVVEEAWKNRAENLPIQSKYDAITLASIVEKETGISEERAKVAAVFINRLKRGMRLQSDPTVIYGITNGTPLGRPIRRSELREETAYNTYRIKGLPPTPIANPGIASIRAVLNPADVSYLYFVADGSGGHVFAHTLKEHNANVRKWRKFQREASAKNGSSK